MIEQKTKKTRRIKLNHDLLEIISRVKRKQLIDDDNEFIFINKYGTKPIDKSWVNVSLKKIFKKYKVHVDGNVSTHMFRKTLGNRVLKLNNYSQPVYRSVNGTLWSLFNGNNKKISWYQRKRGDGCL